MVDELADSLESATSREVHERSAQVAWHLIAPLAAVTCLTLLVCLRIGFRGWDDGAITVAFARTFAETGRISLTPLSEQVEGFSSISWFLIQAAAAKTGLSAAGSILIAQAIAGLCAIASAVVMLAIGRRLNLRPTTLVAVVWIFAVGGAVLNEIANGMEMALLCLSGLVLVHSLYFKRNWVLALIATTVFLTTRFESCIYYAFMVTPLLIRREFRAFGLMAAFGLMIFAAEEYWRWIAFGDWMPNTVRAKVHPPYSPTSVDGALSSRIIALLEIGSACAPLIVAVALMGVVFSTRAPSQSVKPGRNLWISVAMPAVAVEVFALIGGQNSLGPLGRMQLLGVPSLLLLLGGAFDRMSASVPSDRRRLLIGVCAAGSVVASWIISAPHTFMALVTPAFVYDPVSAENIQLTGKTADHLRVAMGRERATFLTPDIGGVGLCCERLRIVDLAMLANSRLARQGDKAIAGILDQERPDLIETHEVWSQLSQLPSLTSFRANYTPILVNYTRMYVRNDHIQSLLSAGVVWCSVTDERCRAHALLSHRGTFVPTFMGPDDVDFLRAGRFLELDNDHGVIDYR